MRKDEAVAKHESKRGMVGAETGGLSRKNSWE
jgi:hypothetical protein